MGAYQMNKFGEIFVKIYNSLRNGNRKDKLEYAIELWCDYVNIPQEIKAKIYDTRKIIQIIKPYGNIDLVKDLVKPTIDYKDMSTIYVILALLVIGIAYVIYQLNQTEDNTNFSDLSEDREFTQKQQNQKYRLILAIDTSMSGFLQNIQESDSFIQDESICENLFSATKYLWIGKKSEDIRSLQKMNQSYKVENENRKNFDVYIVEIILDEYLIGFEKDVRKVQRLKAFRNLINHKVTISERLSFEACSDLYSI
jgi:hypothetical protein